MIFRPEDSVSVTEFAVPERFQSWKGVVHGGMVALLLDEAVGWAAWHRGHPGVTGKLEVRLRQPLRLGERVRIAGRGDSMRLSLIYRSAGRSRRSAAARLTH